MLFGVRYRVFLIKGSSNLGTVTDKLIDILCLFAKWLPVLRMTSGSHMRVSNHHHIRGCVKLVYVLVPCCYIALILNRTLPMRCVVEVVPKSILRTTKRRVNLCHIQCQFFCFCHSLGGQRLNLIVWFLCLNTHPCSFLETIGTLADFSYGVSSCSILYCFSGNLHAHETGDSIFHNIDGP